MISIRTKLSVVLSAAAVVTALTIGFITYRHTLAENEALFDIQLKQIALSLLDYGWAQPPVQSRQNERQELDVVIQVWSDDGRILYLSHPANPVPERAVPGYADMVGPTRRWRVYSIVNSGLIVQVAQPIELRRDLAAAAALRSLTPLLAFLPIMALLIWWLVGQAMRPIYRITADVDSRDERLLEQISAKGVPPEISPLVHALNALLRRLTKAFTSQRSFVADAAHELRSPLTALKLQLQLLERAKEDSERREAMQNVNRGVERATRLVEQLLNSARVEADEAFSLTVEVDLAELVRQIVGELFEFMQQRQVDLTLDSPDRATALGDPASLQILVRNLLDNAIRYSPEGATVLVSIEQGKGTTVLTVEDSGPGIPDKDKGRVFDRFYRGVSQEQTGSGLGLSIVQKVAQQHGANVLLKDSKLGGLMVRVEFSN